ncbi:MAG: diflavin flavoprotein [Cyanobacteria bacterium Co-bin13]|nr:diflavin flavoprotein [Cyanobacteria bacterium Co-bin13]
MTSDTAPIPLTLEARPRDVQIAEIGPNTQVLRSRTWDRLKFETEYARQQGTTANTYLIQADRTALIDPPGGSFTALFLEELRQRLDLQTLGYIVLNHVNPNRMMTLQALVEQAPQARIVCTRPATKALKAAFPGWAERLLTVRSGESLDLGQSHRLKFLAVPTPRWPDGMVTFDPATRILYSDKLFGVHVCSDAVWDEDWKGLDADRRHYFGCLHATQAKQVTDWLDRAEAFPARYWAPGHGPIVRYSLSRLGHDYRQWCQETLSRTLRVALLYASAYGNTAQMADAIAQGLQKSGIAVDALNCELAEPEEIAQVIDACDGFIIGSPTLGGHAPVQIQTALGIVLAAAAKTKPAGVFGSFGWSGEAVDLIAAKLRDANYRFGFEPLRIRFTPTPEDVQTCEQAGVDFAQQLRRVRNLRSHRQNATETHADRTQQAVGRVIGSLGVLTYRSELANRGILATWVSQATFNPPGLMIAVSSDLTLQPGDPLVFNILKEGRNVRRHFTPAPPTDAQPFPEVATTPATNDCAILTEALAYVECTVQNAIDCGDHRLLYAIVSNGDVLEPTGVAAIRHRKSGSEY